MTKSAAAKLVQKIQENRVEALLKYAYEAGASTHASILGATDEEAVSFAKHASVNAQKRASHTIARRQEIASRLKSLLK